jgi:hypothetical protein
LWSEFPAGATPTAAEPDKEPFVLPKIDGRTLSLDLEHNYKSPYMECRTGSEQVLVTYGSRRWLYDFARNTVTESQ